MCHTEEEVGLIDGMRRSYFAPQSISEQVRLRYWKTHQHLSGSTGIVDFKFEYRVKYDSGSSYDRKTEHYQAPYRKRSTGRSFEMFWKVRLLSILLVVERPWILLSLALAIGAVRILTRLLESNGIQRTGGEIPRRFFAPSSAPIRPSSFAASPRCRVLPTVHCSPFARMRHPRIC